MHIYKIELRLGLSAPLHQSQVVQNGAVPPHPCTVAVVSEKLKMDRQQLSGSAKRKLKKEKDLRQRDIIQNVKAITNFFVRKDATPAAADAGDFAPSSSGAKVSASTSSEANACASSEASGSDTQADGAAYMSLSQGIYPVKDSGGTGSTENVGNVKDFTISTDPELWGPITEHVREVAISKGPAAFHNRAPKYPA